MIMTLEVDVTAERRHYNSLSVRAIHNPLNPLNPHTKGMSKGKKQK